MATVDCSWYCKLIARPEQSLRDVTRFTQLSRDTWRAHPYHSWRARPAASASTGGIACRRLPTLLRLPLLLPLCILPPPLCLSDSVSAPGLLYKCVTSSHMCHTSTSISHHHTHVTPLQACHIMQACHIITHMSHLYKHITSSHACDTSARMSHHHTHTTPLQACHIIITHTRLARQATRGGYRCSCVWVCV